MEGGPLSRMLSQEDLEMVDAVKLRLQSPGPHTFVRVSCQIDGVCVTKDVNVSRACFLPFYFGVGDHCGIVIDIPRETFLGGTVHSIVTPTSHRLVCSNPEVQ